MNIQYNPYTILGIAPNASDDDIKRAFRKLAQRLHPDSNPGNESALLQFQQVSEAHQILTDPQMKRQYEQFMQEIDTSQDTYFTLRTTPSKRAIMPLEEEQVIYLLTEIFPAPPTQSNDESTKKNTASLNLTLVLDQSNSMKDGNRIERVKVAAQQIIDQMSENDILSLIVFNDRASVIIPATRVEDKAALRARVSMIRASGGTEIYQGLEAGYKESKTYLSPMMINHIILLTDGHTYGDQEQCIALAEEAREDGIRISAMGIGSDWNDDFLDELVSKTGGGSEYIRSSDLVIKFLNDHVRNLSNAFAERMEINIASNADVHLEMAFALAPSPQPLNIDGATIPLPALQPNRSISILLQFGLPANMEIGFRSIARLVAQGDIMQNTMQGFTTVSDLSVEIAENPPKDEPPATIMDALSKLTLYRLQEKARDAIDRGDIEEATRRLENLATRLLEIGEHSLAQQTVMEAQNIAKTNMLSEKGRKTIKYETRALLGQDGLQQALSSLLSAPDESNP